MLLNARDGEEGSSMLLMVLDVYRVRTKTTTQTRISLEQFDSFYI